MDTIETATPKSIARKPRKKRVATKRKPPAVAGDGAYTGLTAVNCAAACNVARCVISGLGICAHPYKGGLQAGLQDPAAARRLADAKRVIGKRKLDLAAE